MDFRIIMICLNITKLSFRYSKVIKIITLKMERNMKSHFTYFSPIQYKCMLESFVTSNGISFRDIDFECSYVRVYKRREQKEKFDLLEHVNEVKFKDYFVCQCKKNFKFYEHFWQYDTCHNNNYCSFKMRCNYF